MILIFYQTTLDVGHDCCDPGILTMRPPTGHRHWLRSTPLSLASSSGAALDGHQATTAYFKVANVVPKSNIFSHDGFCSSQKP